MAPTAQAISAATSETIHTTANHPWLTTDRGWVLAGDLHAGEPVRTLDGQVDTVAWVHSVPGQADYYNLTVADDHTYAVGGGQYVVHNDDVCGLDGLQPMGDRVNARWKELRAEGRTEIPSGVVVRDTATGEGLASEGVFNGTNKGAYMGSKHGENLSIGAADKWLKLQVARGMSGDVTVDVVTAADPCSEYCTPAWDSGTWLGRLQMTGGGDYTIQLRLWRITPSGQIVPAQPQY